MSMIDVNHLTFTHDGSYEPVFADVSFQFDTDWKLGFVGRNGRGKTTFLKLLMGVYDYGGTISAGVTFEYFPYTVENNTDFTIDVIRAVVPAAENWEICRELSLLGVDGAVLWQSFNSLSFGERTKSLLAALFLKENAFLLIDEPTNHLDVEGRAKLAAYLAKKRGFLLVSHDRAFLDGCVDHILAINRTNIEVQQGNFSSWQRSKALRDQYELAENERLKKDIARLDAAGKRTAAWAGQAERGKYGTRNAGLRVDRGYIGHKSAKMMKRAKVIEQRREDALEEKRRLLQNLEREQSLALTQEPYHAKRLAEMRDVSVSYNGRQICGPVSLTIERGDRIALWGKNGCGKSSLLRLIHGEEVPHSGSMTLGSGLKISYVGQSAEALQGNLADYIREHNLEEHRFKAILRKLDFSREQFEKDMAAFSGGQKKKVLLARSLCESAHLYIWDEPLNYIDVFSRMQIEELLLEDQPTLLFVEHDAAFLEKIATKVVAL